MWEEKRTELADIALSRHDKCEIYSLRSIS